MIHTREPLLETVKIIDLRPTQITVGFREVAAKRKRWHDQQDRKAGKFLGQHLIPVILGPRRCHYVIDHHHLTRALHEEGVENVATTIVADLSALERDSFWFVLDNRGWMHPFDAGGKRRDYRDIPKTIEALVDDPFRSLAWALRRAGGCAKDVTPFSDFLWADFLRQRMKRRLIEDDFDHALEKAMELGRSKEAAYLPGWCGPSADD